jgi:hypothetical protein
MVIKVYLYKVEKAKVLTIPICKLLFTPGPCPDLFWLNAV